MQLQQQAPRLDCDDYLFEQRSQNSLACAG
jgi:hypothetical protein